MDNEINNSNNIDESNNNNEQENGWLNSLPVIGTIILFIIGLISGLIGFIQKIKAKLAYKKAKKIRDEAISKVEESEKRVNDHLEKLGSLEMTVADSMKEFVELFEQIKSIDKDIIPQVTISNIAVNDFKPLKTLSSDFRIAAAGVVGAGVGMSVCAALIGINPITWSAGVAISGVVICMKGYAIKKEAVQTVADAKRIQSEAETILQYHTELNKAADDLYAELSSMNDLYGKLLDRMRDIVSTNRDYRSYTPDQITVIKSICTVV